jgi:hypothetical protein
VSQTTQEPFVGPLGLADDRNDIGVQYWASLRDTDGSQESIWGQPCSSLTDFQHSNIVRQWAELAYWFPVDSIAIVIFIEAPLGNSCKAGRGLEAV